MARSDSTIISQHVEMDNMSKGMTTRVMKGSFWVLIGQLLPLLATFVSTPFVIRYLGSEAYGVLLLISMIPSYFSYMDVGMSLASTRFGSEAYGDNLLMKESKVVWTACFIASIPVIIVCILLVIFSDKIMYDFFSVAQGYREAASIGLKLTAVAFVFSTMSTIVNTPQLSRLKMHLNVLVNAGPKFLMTCMTPFVLYFGFGIEGATLWACCIALLILILNFSMSVKLLPQLKNISIDKRLFSPLLSFGKGIVVYAIALMLINYMEKILIPRIMESPTKNLAYYSVAFTLANMANLFSMSMVQTLMPAFSQLLTPQRRQELELLFSRCVRISIILIIPTLVGMAVIAKPFFKIWAGDEFGDASVIPFYTLLIGMFFSLLAYVPNTVLLASGRSKLFARYYIIELLPYGILTYFFILKFGILGAAIAWSIKEITNALFFIYYAKKHQNLDFNFRMYFRNILYGLLIFLPPLIAVSFSKTYSFLPIALLLPLLVLYFILVWKSWLDESERKWLQNKLRRKI